MCLLFVLAVSICGAVVAGVATFYMKTVKEKEDSSKNITLQF